MVVRNAAVSVDADEGDVRADDVPTMPFPRRMRFTMRGAPGNADVNNDPGGSYWVTLTSLETGGRLRVDARGGDGVLRAPPERVPAEQSPDDGDAFRFEDSGYRMRLWSKRAQAYVRAGESGELLALRAGEGEQGEPEDDSRRGTPLHFLRVEEEIARRCSRVLLGDA